MGVADLGEGRGGGGHRLYRHLAVRLFQAPLWACTHNIPQTSGRNGGGRGVKPPKCARKCANFRNLKANVQILDRKTPPPKWFTLFRLLPQAPYGAR